MNSNKKKAIKTLFLILVITAAYIGLARVGLMYALNPGFATAFFPSAGLAVAAILIFGSDVWPGIFFGSLIADLITPVPGMILSSILVGAGIGLGSTLQAVTLGNILNNVTGVNYLFCSYRNVIIFLFATMACCLIASTIGNVVLLLGKIIPADQFLQNWATWWVGDMMGIWLFTPLFLTWSKYKIPWNPAMFLEAFVLFCVTVAIAIFCFGGWIKNGFPVYLIIPCLLWSVFRFQPSITTSFLTLVSLIAVWGTSSGFGPFVLSTENESLLLMQLFIGVITLMTLILISLLNALRHNTKILEELNDKLVEKNRMLQEKNQKNKKNQTQNSS